MTTVARVIGLKGMPMGKTLVGSFSQPRDHRLPKENFKKNKNKVKKATHAKNGAFTFIIANCKSKTIQESNSKQITFTDYTILNACPRARDVPRLTTHPALPLRRWSRAEIGATPLVWSPTRPSSERTVIYRDGPLGCLSNNLCHLGLLLRRHQLY